MALPVWGNLEKSQVDAETIEEAAARLIQAHEDDPNAHVEVGESLQSHKAAAIIDHVVASIIADKIKQDEVIPKHIKTFCDLNFDIGLIDDFLDWSSHTAGTGSTAKKFRLSEVKTGANAASEASNYLELAAGPAIGQEMRFDAKVYLNEDFGHGDKAYINFWPENVEPGTGDNLSKCFGFIIEGVVVAEELSYKIYGFVRRLAVLSTTLLIEDLEATNSLVLTVYFNGSATFYFYVDNVYKSALVRASMGPWGFSENIVHSIENVNAANAESQIFWINYKIWVP